MRIDDDHMYHGAALTQIAEHPSFTSINAFKDGETKSRSAFVVNEDTVIYIKYASVPKGIYKEYAFNFTNDHLKELAAIKSQCERCFVALVCIEDREICSLRLAELRRHISRRKIADGKAEDQYSLLVTAQKGKRFRVYMNDPHKKKASLRQQLVARTSFPLCYSMNRCWRRPNSGGDA